MTAEEMQQAQADMTSTIAPIYEDFVKKVDEAMKAKFPDLLIAHVGVVVTPIGQDNKLSEVVPVQVIATTGNDASALMHMAQSFATSAHMHAELGEDDATKH